MGYRNPLTSLPADKITSGDLGGEYQVTGAILAGDTAGSHIAIGPSGLIFYAADGVTPLIELDASSALGTITAADIRTAASGQRFELLSNPAGALFMYSGNPAETTPGLLQDDGRGIALQTYDLGGGRYLPTVTMHKDTGQQSNLDLMGDSVTVSRSANPAEIYARDDLVVAQWSETAGANGQVTVNFPAGAFSGPFVGVPLVFVQAISGFSQWVVATITSTGFTLTTRGATGTAPAVGTTLSGMYLAIAP